MVDEINDVELIRPGDGRQFTYAQIREAVQKENDGRHYYMSLTDKAEIAALVAAVNAGIDSRLQACYVPNRGDKYGPGDRKIGKLVVARTMECSVSPESLPVLLRRLLEDASEKNSEAAYSLADAILLTLGFNDRGEFVGREALGLD